MPGPKDEEGSGPKEEYLAAKDDDWIGLQDEDAELNDGERLYEASEPNGVHDETRGGSCPLCGWRSDAIE